MEAPIESAELIKRHYERLDQIGYIDSPLESIRNANHLLIFGFFVAEAFQSERITHENLASVLRVHTGGPGVTLRQPPGDLFGHAENTKLALLGACIQAVDQSLAKAFGPRPTPAAASTDLDWARIGIYMIRSCFAHNPFAPTWECRPPYQAVIAVKHVGFLLDTRMLHGVEMMPQHFGGFEKLLMLLLYCEEAVEAAKDH